MISSQKYFLKPGDTIGLVAPSGFISRREVEEGIEILRLLNFKVKLDSRIFEKERFFAGSALLRADILNAMLSDSEVDAVLCVRGGSGSVQIIPFLEKMEKNKWKAKPFMGFSDQTTLLNYFPRECGWIVFHTHVLRTLMKAGQIEKERWLEEIQGRHIKRDLAGEFGKDLKVLEKGQSEGELAGGNLATLVSNIGTPWQAKLDGKILFLEETGEYPYRIERCLTQLSLGGFFSRIKGVILGKFVFEDRVMPDEDLFPIFRNYFTPLNIPVIANFPAGHGALNKTLPFGAMIMMETSSISIKCIDTRLVSLPNF